MMNLVKGTDLNYIYIFIKVFNKLVHFFPQFDNVFDNLEKF